MAFGCHPDDVEYMAAGTLALLADSGYEVHIATMTGGEVGHPTLNHQEIRRQRLEEAHCAAALLRGQFHYAGGCDLEVEYSREYRRCTTHVLREVQPEIILTAPPLDYLPDHEITSLLVRAAATAASVPHYDTGEVDEPLAAIPYLYYWDAFNLSDIFGRPLPLTCAVNISTVIETKAQMLACHASQREWLRYLNGWDKYIDVMREQDKRQGQRAGTQYAEGFLQHLGVGHPTDNILKTVLGDRCVEFTPNAPE